MSRRRRETLSRDTARLGSATILAAILLAACGPGENAQIRRAEEPPPVTGALQELRERVPLNILLVTMDTTRSDRIGAYGFAGVETPAIDQLANEGVLFQRAYSPVPLTLPAHVSLFTGSNPYDHGVRDNTGFAAPDALTTLAEVLQDNDYATAAFVSAYVLAPRWGLDQGFDVYSDGLGVEARRAEVMLEAQRPADEVVDEALRWLADTPQAPYFLWVHLYDPHVPYAPPEPYRSRYPDDPYAGEIAFMDSQIRRLVERVRDDDGDRTLFVLAADHGESLGEHGELEHGFFVYEGATRIPLIFTLPAGLAAGRRSEAPVSLIDVMPTVLEAVGIDAPDASRGRSLLPLFLEPDAESDRVVYSETYYPRLHYGWSELAAVQDARYKLIASPEPELYDLATDPAESINLAGTERAVYDRLDEALQQMLESAAAADARVQIDAAARSTLESLGYLAGPAPAAGTGRRPAPLSRIDIYNKTLRARDLKARGRLDEAARLYNEILDEDPEVLIAYERLGEIYMLQGRYEEAAETFAFAIPLRPDWYDPHNRLAENLINLGRYDEAERTLQGALRLAPPNPVTFCTLGFLAEQRDDYRSALGYYDSCRELDATSPEPLTYLARVHLQTGELDRAEARAREALALDPSAEGAHFVVARVEEERGASQAAIEEYQAELRNTPDHVDAHFGLAMLYGEAGRSADEQRHLEAILRAQPGHPLAALFLANIFLARGDNYQRGVELVTAAVEEPLSRDDLAAGYFILSQLHDRLGNIELAREYLRRAEEIGRERVAGVQKERRGAEAPLLYYAGSEDPPVIRPGISTA